jgi:DnaJ family protein C protein 17
MPSSSFIGKDGMPLKDPYKILDIPHTASEADVKKAYRQLALKLHPDKQSGTSLTDSQRVDLDARFHDVKDARSFLLDAEHAELRRKYDANLASERTRQAEEERRERTMSTRRKRMREELITRERMAARTTTTSTSSAPAGGGGDDATTTADRFDVDRLRREGERLRAEYTAREAEAELARRRREAAERASLELRREERRVRLKWSRKKVSVSVGVGGFGGSHTRSSIMAIMGDFGVVEDVEMLGSRGNSALVTFANASSCAPCVDAYRTSEEMRASFLGRRKADDIARGGRPFADAHDDFQPSSTGGSGRDAVEEEHRERNFRREAERERLMRQMEFEEAGGGVDDDRPSRGATTSETGDDGLGRSGGQPRGESNFPPDFPATPENESLSPFQLLEKYEQIILGC